MNFAPIYKIIVKINIYKKNIIIKQKSNMVVCLSCQDPLVGFSTMCDKGHYICDECFVLMNEEERGTVKNRECPIGKCGSFLVLSPGSQKFEFKILQKEKKEREEIDAHTKQALLSAEEKASTSLHELIPGYMSALFDEVAKPTEKCPRCEQPFDGFDGCNALKCPRCKTGFCALCLENCGEDAHTHLNVEHPVDIWHKLMYLKKKEERQMKQIIETLAKVKPFMDLIDVFEDLN